MDVKPSALLNQGHCQGVTEVLLRDVLVKTKGEDYTLHMLHSFAHIPTHTKACSHAESIVRKLYSQLDLKPHEAHFHRVLWAGGVAQAR
jgi:hypothetical protein